MTLPEVPRIDDADDPRVRGHFGRMKRKTGLFSTYEEHVLADAGADRVGRNDDAPDGLTRRRDRLHEQQRHAIEGVVPHAHHHRSDNTA
jgi:hypothetical protein